MIVDEDVLGSRAPRFFVENEAGGYAATRLLVEAGHRDIAHIGGPRGVMSAIERADGWRRALTEPGLSPGLHICTEYEVEPAAAAAAELFAQGRPPSAVFAGSDAIALGVMMQARAHGVVIPHDMSLVGFDGLPIVDLLGPPLTSVAQPIDELGRRAASRLVAMIGGAANDADTLRLPVHLVVRGSVGPPSPQSGPHGAA